MITAPQHIFLIGGGRWARTMLSTLGAISLPESRIVVRSAHNQTGMMAWLQEVGLDHRVTVTTDWPSLLPGSTACVIVANAARDHEEAIQWALTQGYPVLAEKPITLSGDSLRYWVVQAEVAKALLCPAQVFLFAPWMNRFAAEVAARGDAHAIELEFEDPGGEIRHGESKRFDPGVPIFMDWLPHAMAILGTLLPALDGDCERIELTHGGAGLMLFLRLSGRPCCLRFRRNGQSRRRRLGVEVAGIMLQLDFALEPATILLNGEPVAADPSWSEQPRPLATMLKVFLESVAGGTRDPRFGLEAALSAGRLMDQVRPMYRAALLPWLHEEMASGRVGDELMYALNELAYSRALVLHN